MTLTDLLTIAAAVWYVSYVITSSDGPFDVFKHLRTRLPLGGLTACIICTSIWVAIVFTLAPIGWITQAAAVAGIALWVHNYSGWKYNP